MVPNGASKRPFDRSLDRAPRAQYKLSAFAANGSPYSYAPSCRTVPSLSLLLVTEYIVCFTTPAMPIENSNAPHSLPIPIEGRRRSESVSGSDSSSDSGSNSPASPLQTPITGTLPRIAPISPSTSPILSYFLSQSPKSTPTATFPFRRGMGGPGFFDGKCSRDSVRCSR